MHPVLHPLRLVLRVVAAAGWTRAHPVREDAAEFSGSCERRVGPSPSLRVGKVPLGSTTTTITTTTTTTTSRTRVRLVE